jgi:hypothetical protein
MQGDLYFDIPHLRVAKNFWFSGGMSDLISPRTFAREYGADVVTRWHRVRGYHTWSSTVNQISIFPQDMQISWCALSDLFIC